MAGSFVTGSLTALTGPIGVVGLIVPQGDRVQFEYVQ